MKKNGGFAILVAMLVLFGLSLMTVSLATVINSTSMATSGRLIKLKRADEVTEFVWAYMNANVNTYFAAKNQTGQFINLEDAPPPFNWVKGRALVDIFYFTYDPSTGLNEELLGWTSPPPGYDLNQVGVYIYSVVIHGKEGAASVFSAPGASNKFNIFIKQIGLPQGSVD